MYFALGLLSAGLLALLVMPAIWRRTARLTRQRIERTVPMTLAEIEADKDQLRAEFAMTARRLEMTVDRLRDKTTEQLIEINEKRAEIVRLSNDRDDKAKTIENLEERAARLVADLAAADERLAKATDTIRQRETTIAERDSEIATLRDEVTTGQQLSAEQKLEIVARNTEIGNLNDSLADAKTREEALTAERDGLAASLAAEQEALAAERRRVANLEASIARLEAERIDRLAEIERRAAEARELLAELDKTRTHAEDLAAKVAAFEAEQTARNTEFERRLADIKATHAIPANGANGGQSDESMHANGDNIAKAIAAAEMENTELRTRIADMETEQAELRAENDNLRRVASGDWDIESENALLRERLAGVAADVIKLTDSIADSPLPATVLSDTGNGAALGNGNGAQHHGPDETDSPKAQGFKQVSAPQQGPTLPAAVATQVKTSPSDAATPPGAPSKPVSTPKSPAPPAVGDSPQPAESKSLAERLRALQDAGARH